jgi:hypothetical protein
MNVDALRKQTREAFQHTDQQRAYTSNDERLLDERITYVNLMIGDSQISDKLDGCEFKQQLVIIDQ